MNRYPRFVIFCLFFAVILISGCATPDDTNGAVNVTGCWQGEWRSTVFNNTDGKFQVTLEQSGSELSGNAVITGSGLTGGGTISGSTSGNSLNFGLMAGAGINIIYSGTVSDDSMLGNWEAVAAVVIDSGIWQAAKDCTDDFLTDN